MMNMHSILDSNIYGRTNAPTDGPSDEPMDEYTTFEFDLIQFGLINSC